MKFDILHLDSLSSGSSTGGLEHDLIVKAQTQLGHTTEVTLHLNSTKDFRTEDVAICGNQQVKGFDDIKEDLVLAVSDTLGSPRNSVCDSNRWSGLDLELVGFLGDVLLKDLGFCRLRVTKVHHLVEKFVDNDKVVANGLFF